MKIKTLIFAMVAASAFASVATVQASITGSLWESIADTGSGSDAVAGNIPARAADVTFSVANGGLNFSSIGTVPGTYPDGSGGYWDSYYTIGSWLNTGGATGLTYQNGAVSSDSMNDTILEFKGTVTVTSGEQFTVTHDDGLTLTIGSQTVISAPGPTAPITTTETYSGPSGDYAFDLIYAEVQGAPAVLQVDLPFQPVPEAPTVIAGALLLLPLGAGTLRILRKNRTA